MQQYLITKHRAKALSHAARDSNVTCMSVGRGGGRGRGRIAHAGGFSYFNRLFATNDHMV